MNDLEALVTRSMREHAQEASMSVDTPKSVQQLQSRLDEEDRARRRRTTLLSVAAAVVLVAVGVGALVWGTSRTQSQPISPTPAPSAPAPAQSVVKSLAGGPFALVRNDFSASPQAFWVVLRDARSVVAWDAATSTSTATVPLPGTPVSATFGGKKVAVVVTQGGRASIAVVDEATTALQATYPFAGDPVTVKTSATNGQVLILDRTSGTVSQLDLASGRTLARSPRLASATVMSTVTAGARLINATDAVSNPVVVGTGSILSILDPVTLAVRTTFQLPGTVVGIEHSATGTDPYVVSLADGTVLLTDGATAPTTLGRYPAGSVAWTATGTDLWLLGTPAAQLVSSQDGSVLRTTVPDQTSGATFVYTATDGTVWAARPDANQVVQLPAG